MKVLNSLLVTISVITLAACQQQTGEQQTPETNSVETKSTATTSAETTAAPEADVIATVNDRKISASEFQDYISLKMASNPTSAGNPALVLNEMINKELLLQAAKTGSIDKKPEVMEQIKTSTENILVNTLINDRVSKIDNSDTALKAEYDAQLAAVSLKEYKASHILVNDEETAKGLITELNGGKDFAELAKEKSTGPSGPNGGDLGWFQMQTMVPEFGAALETMEKGSISNVPVKTQFGWHVIKLEDTRDMAPPSFEESKAQLKNILANRTVQNYMAELRKQATINIKDPVNQLPQTQQASPAPTEESPAETK